MSKYIDTDKLIAEIERRIQWCEDCERDGYPNTTSSEATLKSLRSFITSFQQERSETPSGEEVMNMCNQILIDWVKEGKTPEEREQREQAHIRFFELYDEYMEWPDMDLEKEYKRFIDCDNGRSMFDCARHFAEWGAEWQREQYECIPAEEAYMNGFTKGADEERERMLEDIIKMRDTAEKRGLNFGAVCGFQIALDELEQRLTGKH